MADHNDIGLKGEREAERFLVHNGYQILERNWRHEKGEIDLICRKDGNLVFVEVKTRSSTTLRPEDLIDRKKIQMLAQTAHAFLEEFDDNLEVRFDVVFIVNGESIDHIQDVFTPEIE